MPIILASTSPFRRELLGRLNLAFKTATPDVDESRLGNETAEALVRRLSEGKARAVGALQPGLIIGSDQVATIDGEILGKPGTHEQARDQLRRLSGRSVLFLTGLCLLNSATDELQIDVIPFRVQFRELDDEQIERYLQHDQPYNCAGSFKSEGLGITLFERMEGDDPTALIGLPLIRLTGMLTRAGVPLP
ncbi:MAG: Maf family nucleotide pyrophosphatase [Gammaproteobacteria bacterium]|nr:Maf family nucleotide pyrophosphatase [Gammaproteobacteria bacterium]MDH3560115.1 Maf family nucleotide pyrophosphatase [Gammaproteobacteria bacterium]